MSGLISRRTSYHNSSFHPRPFAYCVYCIITHCKLKCLSYLEFLSVHLTDLHQGTDTLGTKSDKITLLHLNGSSLHAKEQSSRKTSPSPPCVDRPKVGYAAGETSRNHAPQSRGQEHDPPLPHAEPWWLLPAVNETYSDKIGCTYSSTHFKVKYAFPGER